MASGRPNNFQRVTTLPPTFRGYPKTTPQRTNVAAAFSASLLYSFLGEELNRFAFAALAGTAAHCLPWDPMQNGNLWRTLICDNLCMFIYSTRNCTCLTRLMSFACLHELLMPAVPNSWCFVLHLSACPSLTTTTPAELLVCPGGFYGTYSGFN